MNFNLISPPNEGGSYRISFREPIEINPNSKVYLNFADLIRAKTVTFPDDQTFEIISESMYPKYIKDGDSYILNKVQSQHFIKAGTYTNKELEEEIKLIMNNKKEEQFHYYIGETSAVFPSSDIYMGYDLSPEWETVDLVLDSSNNKNFIKDNTLGYINNDPTAILGAAGVYNAYGLASTNFFHYSYIFDTSTINDMSAIYFETNKAWGDLDGNVCLSLYSTEYMGLSWAGYQYINGSNFYTENIDTAEVPKCFLNIEVLKNNTPPVLRISAPNIENGKIMKGTIYMTLENYQIIKDIPLNSIMSFNSKIKLNLVTYVKIDDLNKDNVYFKIIDTNNLTIYDSATDNISFVTQFFILDNPTSDAEANVGVPFKVLLSASQYQEGFSVVKYREFDKGVNYANATRSIIKNYKFHFGYVLANYFNTTVYTKLFHPNLTLSPLRNFTSQFESIENNFYFITDIDFDFLNDSYYIEIEEIPLKNYKNIESNNNGGYSRNILSPILLPFKNSNLQENNKLYDNYTVNGTYTPNFPSVVSMRNQKVITNKFTVHIKNLRTDKEAKELLQSIINFTIE